MTQDSNGLLWVGSDAGLFKYDGYKVVSIKEIIPSSNILNVRTIDFDKHNTMWVGTKGDGLFKINNDKISRFDSEKHPDKLDNNFITAALIDEHGLWFSSYNNLNYLSADHILNYPLVDSHNSENTIVTAITVYEENTLLISTQNSIFLFDKKNHTFERISIEDLNIEYISTVYVDYESNIWAATNKGLFVKYQGLDSFQQYNPEELNYSIYSVAVDKNYIWLGSIYNGLIRITKNNKSVVKYIKEAKNSTSISGNSIMLLHLNYSGILFASSFHGGISYFNTNTLKFGLLENTDKSIHCSDVPIIFGIFTDNDEDYWLASEAGLIEYNQTKNSCINHNKNTDNTEIYIKNHPISLLKDSEKNLWIGTTKGLDTINNESNVVDQSIQNSFNEYVYFVFQPNPTSFILGTANGLYEMKNKELVKIELQENEGLPLEVTNYSSGPNGSYFLGTSLGIANYNKNGIFSLNRNLQSYLPTKEISSIYVNEKHDLWIGVRNHGLYKFNKNHQLVTNYSAIDNTYKNHSIVGILEQDEFLWMSTEKGMIRLNTQNNESNVYTKSDGLQGDYFIMGSSFKSASGKLYFGGRNGMNAFYPKDIVKNVKPPSIILSNLTRFGKNVKPNEYYDDFIINKHINDMSELVLTHKDYVIGFEFVAVDFADPSRNKYAFKMEGLDPDWNYVDANNRKISYSNLKAGEYTFKVKGSNSDGVWNEEGKSLSVIVLPAPWLTWWAYTLYAITFILLLSLYIHKKNKANIRINKMLRKEVKRQTKQLSLQKQKVETLLERKNEMFANVSHEFRTPLTLILGPINQLLQTNLANSSIESLKMVNRNAKRLLTMIEQFLLLAKMTNPTSIEFISQQIEPSIENIVNSFQNMAEQNNIKLELKNNDDAAVNASQDAIEIILSNLISNAIKYSEKGGEVTVISRKLENSVEISVEDTGCGLNEMQQEEVFNRFNRLEAHQKLPGVGIGLSVVKEIVKLNKGTIKVSSEVNKGSKFTVSFQCIALLEKTQDTRVDNTIIDKILEESLTTDNSDEENIQFVGNKKNKIILIIDDNQDMRTHVADTLKHQYYCILADRGKRGIAYANEYVPDIIICDVMMPEMDGFTVSRILRSDTKTSHIPLVLLTALNDKKSRIKGWRENIDVYLTKPFDADELLVQLENILVIRNILIKKAGTAIKAGKFSMNSGLPEKDRLFVEKFINILSANFTRFNLLRPEMASLMAVSERQLQRKIKALIGKNPLDLLREFRLEKATHVLKEGYQIGVTSDKCGFNTVTYFSKCFKETYGMSPKEYQISFKKKNN